LNWNIPLSNISCVQLSPKYAYWPFSHLAYDTNELMSWVMWYITLVFNYQVLSPPSITIKVAAYNLLCFVATLHCTSLLFGNVYSTICNSTTHFLTSKTPYFASWCFKFWVGRYNGIEIVLSFVGPLEERWFNSLGLIFCVIWPFANI